MKLSLKVIEIIFFSTLNQIRLDQKHFNHLEIDQLNRFMIEKKFTFSFWNSNIIMCFSYMNDAFIDLRSHLSVSADLRIFKCWKRNLQKYEFNFALIEITLIICVNRLLRETFNLHFYNFPLTFTRTSLTDVDLKYYRLYTMWVLWKYFNYYVRTRYVCIRWCFEFFDGDSRHKF